jgi:hypothetical protein
MPEIKEKVHEFLNDRWGTNREDKTDSKINPNGVTKIIQFNGVRDTFLKALEVQGSKSFAEADEGKIERAGKALQKFSDISIGKEFFRTIEELGQEIGDKALAEKIFVELAKKKQTLGSEPIITHLDEIL